MRIVPKRENPISIFRMGRQASVIMVWTMILCLSVLSFAASAAEAKETAKVASTDGQEDSAGEDVVFHVTLDPGHGGDDSGAAGYGADEKKLTLKLAKMVKEELLKYENVSVGLTRKKDKFVPLKERTRRALKQKADLMVSIHFDSYDPACAYSSGCSAIVAKKGSFRPALNKEEKKAARSILQELSRIGVTNRGLIRRLSTDGETYPDGSVADYYAIIRNGGIHKLPSILVEHAFIDSEHDYYGYLETDDKLREMARADARGIARYLRLKNKETGKILKPLKDNGKTLVCYAKQGSYLSVRDKSYKLALSRNANGFDPSENEEEESKNELANQEETKDQKEAEDRKDQMADSQSTPSSTGALPGARRKSMQLTAGLVLLLLAYYVWISLKEKARKE